LPVTAIDKDKPSFSIENYVLYAVIGFISLVFAVNIEPTEKVTKPEIAVYTKNENRNISNSVVPDFKNKLQSSSEQDFIEITEDCVAIEADEKTEVSAEKPILLSYSQNENLWQPHITPKRQKKSVRNEIDKLRSPVIEAALRHKFGDGVEKDYFKAEKLFRKAILAGSDVGKKCLSDLNSEWENAVALERHNIGFSDDADIAIAEITDYQTVMPSNSGIYSVGDVFVSGYHRRDGTYVRPHYRSKSDSRVTNNWSFAGNINPYTGEVGSRRY